MKTVEKFEMPIARNLIGRTGKAVAKQFVIMTSNWAMFQSHNSRICFYDIDANALYFGTDWNYSRTTAKYLSQFLRVYAPRWYARLMAYGKRSLAGNIQQAITDGVVSFVTDW